MDEKQCFTWVTSAVSPCSNNTVPAVCVWMSGKVSSVLCCSSMWSCVCCCPLHPVYECMTDRCQACHGFPGCCGWDVRGQGEMEVAEERDGERVCHFIQAFLFLTRILTPVLSISISRWLTKELLSYRQVHIKTVCVSLYCMYLNGLRKC